MTKKQKTGKATSGILKYMDPIPEALLEEPNARLIAIMYPHGKGTIRYQILTNQDLIDLVPKLAKKITKEPIALKPSIERTYYCHYKGRFNIYCFGCEFMNIYGHCQFRNKVKLTPEEESDKTKTLVDVLKDGSKSKKNPEVKN